MSAATKPLHDALEPMTLLERRYEDKQSLVVSVIPGQPDEPVVSRYGDAVWDLSPHWENSNIPRHSKRIHFEAIVFADGSRLVDPVHQATCESVKDLFYALCFRMSGASIRRTADYLRGFILWLVDVKGYHRIAQLDDALAYAAYSRSVPSLRMTKPTSIALHERFKAVQLFWTYRTLLTDTFRYPPFRQTTPAKLAGYRKDAVRQTAVIPDDLWQRLMAVALNTLDNADTLLCHRREIDTFIDDHRQQGQSEAAIVQRLLRQGVDRRALNTDLIHVRTACYIVIAGLTGIRNHEALGLELNCVRHDKVTVGDHPLETYYLRGITTKYEQPEEGVMVEWLANQDVHHAVAVLTRLSRNSVNGSMQKSLHCKPYPMRKDGRPAFGFNRARRNGHNDACF